MDDLGQYPQRKSPRLQGYDYAQAGAYFVTVCCIGRTPLFGHIPDDTMVLNETGALAAQCWLALPDHFTTVELDLWVIMPNHMHGILLLHEPEVTLQDTSHPNSSSHSTGEVGTRYCASARPTLGTIINTYKGNVTRLARLHCQSPELRIWQSRYHDHIIRGDQDLTHIREYVIANPARWSDDTFNTPDF